MPVEAQSEEEALKKWEESKKELPYWTFDDNKDKDPFEVIIENIPLSKREGSFEVIVEKVDDEGIS